MKNGLKVMVIAGLLAAGGAIAQGTAPTTKGNASASKPQSKQLVIDEKHHQQMMDDIKKLDAEVESLKKQLAEERKRGIDPAHHEEMMAQQRASDKQVDAVQKSVKNLSAEVAKVPQYQPQDNPNRP
jgi:hypothetical protein